MRVRRVDDTGSLKPAERTKEGYLRCEGLISRAGNVQEYTQADGKIQREYRPPEEVFSPESLASLDGLPFTKEHPPTLLDALTAKQYAVGAVANPRKEGDYVAARIIVYDADMIAAMQMGKQELSVGYDCELDPTPGVTSDGEVYDVVQRNIVGNHVAGVDSARAGEKARVRLDSAGNVDVAPPGREQQVKALEEQPNVENPYAVAWASYNKGDECVDGDGNKLDPGEHADIIKKSGGKWVLHSKKTGKVLGTHGSKGEAMAQERAIQANKHADGQQRFAPPIKPVLTIDGTKRSEKPMPMVVRIDGNNYNADDPALQQAIERAMEKVRMDGERATKAEKERADSLATANGHLKANAIQRGEIVRSLLARFDAAKAKMAVCDECGGSGKVGNGDDAAKCDYCDGKGTYRMHDLVKGAAVDDDDDESEPAEMVDDDDMERDDPEEEKAEKAANSKHKDGKDAARLALKKKRADSIARMVARAAKSRAALMVEGAIHLGPDAKLDTKGDAEIKREVVAKLAPHAKLDGLDEKAIDLLFQVEVGRAAKAREDGLTASDQLRAGTQPQPSNGVTTKRADWLKQVEEANRVKNEAWKRPAAK